MEEVEEPMLSSEQIKIARVLLRIDQHEVVRMTGLSLSTVKRLEGGTGQLECTLKTAVKLKTAFEKRGVVFLEGSAILKDEPR